MVMMIFLILQDVWKIINIKAAGVQVPPLAKRGCAFEEKGSGEE